MTALLADGPGPVLIVLVLGGWVIAGIAATVALVLGGLWVARRLRRKSLPKPDEAPPP